MPLIKSKSKKAFSENVGKEMDDGKPQKQALAIAYGTQRQAKKKMALGGPVEAPMHSKGFEGTPATPMKKPDDMRLPQDQFMGDKWAEGGMIKSQDPAQMAAWHQAQAHKYKMMAEGGMVESEDGTMGNRPESIAEAILMKRKFANGGMVDMEENSEEHPNDYDKQNEDAAGKEQYDDEQISAQPWDSNEDGDAAEDDSENKDDMISSIRSKMKAKAGR